MDSTSFLNYPEDHVLKFNELELLSLPSILWTLIVFASCIVFIMIAFTPLFFGALLLIFLLLTLGKILGLDLSPASNCINYMDKFSWDAFVNNVCRKQTNERFIHGADKMADLRQLFQTTMGEKILTTSMNPDRILVIFPADRSAMNTQRLLGFEDASVFSRGSSTTAFAINSLEFENFE